MSVVFIYVTKSGAVYDRSVGKKRLIRANEDYVTQQGILKFSHSKEGVVLERKTLKGTPGYVTTLTDVGMYMVTPLLTKKLPATKKSARVLFNKLRSVVGPNTKFKIIEEGINEPKIQLVIKTVKGVMQTSFVVRVDPDKLTLDQVLRSVSLVEKTSSLDIRKILTMFMPVNDSLVITIDDDFIDAFSDDLGGRKVMEG